MSGGSGGSSNPAAIKAGIDTSIDIEQLKQDVSVMKAWFESEQLVEKIEEVRAAIVALVFPIATRIPQLRPVVTGAANTTLTTPAIPAPGVGKRLVVQLMGWYDKTPTNGVLTIVGSDGTPYTSVSITSAGAGFMQKAALPDNLGCTIALSAGGAGVTGSLNYAIAIEKAEA